MPNRSSWNYPVIRTPETNLGSRLFMRMLRPNASLLGARDLRGDAVYDSAGRYLGKVVEILVNVRIGCVAWAVVAAGGFLGIGRRRFAIPWNVISPDARYRRCSLTIDHEQLMAPPRIPTIDVSPRRGPSLGAAKLWSDQRDAGTAAGRRPARLDS
jgi:sporulation protein YlmC with PRC-barrel domain